MKVPVIASHLLLITRPRFLRLFVLLPFTGGGDLRKKKKIKKPNLF